MSAPDFPEWNTSGAGDGVGVGDAIPAQVESDGVVFGDVIPATWFNRLARKVYALLAWIVGGEPGNAGRQGRAVYGRSADLVNDAALTDLVVHEIDGNPGDPFPDALYFIEFDALVYVVDGTGAADLVVQFRVGGSVRASLSKAAAAITSGDYWRIKYRAAVAGGGTATEPTGYTIESEYKGDAVVYGAAAGTWNTTTSRDLVVEAQWSAPDANSSVRIEWARARLVKG